jgi:hypothetical protein
MATEEVQNSQETEVAAPTAKEYFGYDTEKLVENVEKAGVSKDIDPQTLVNETLKEIKVDDNGKFIYPDGIDPMLKIAVANAKSFRDTQSAYTKTKEQLKTLEAERNALKEELEKLYSPTAELSEQEKLELEELKITNPDQWYKRMRALEEASSKKIDEKLNEVTTKTKEQIIAEQRELALEEFNKTNDVKLTKENLEFDIPPRWHKQLQDGEITFEELLSKAAKFLGAPKKVKTEEAPQTTDLNKLGGSQAPIKGAKEDDVLSAYQTGEIIL